MVDKTGFGCIEMKVSRSGCICMIVERCWKKIVVRPDKLNNLKDQQNMYIQTLRNVKYTLKRTKLLTRRQWKWHRNCFEIALGGRPRVRDATLSNHWNVLTSIACMHQSNLDWFHSVSYESLKGFSEIEYDKKNISLISRVVSLILSLLPLKECIYQIKALPIVEVKIHRTNAFPIYIS